jgi:hypothetical protein
MLKKPWRNLKKSGKLLVDERLRNRDEWKEIRGGNDIERPHQSVMLRDLVPHMSLTSEVFIRNWVHHVLSFLGFHSRYSSRSVSPEDTGKVEFITEFGAEQTPPVNPKPPSQQTKKPRRHQSSSTSSFESSPSDHSRSHSRSVSKHNTWIIQRG